MRDRLRCACWLVGAALLLSAPAAAASHCTLPDGLLMNAGEFGWKYGPASFTRSDPSGPGVQFDFTGLTASSTALSDDYMISDIGQILPSHGNGDFSNFDGYVLTLQNLNTTGSVDVSLILNTGFTGPSGVPPNELKNDTFWQSPWVSLGPGASQVLFLDFSNAIPYSIDDNPVPHTQGTNGVATAINATDMTEFSNIGFQIAGPAGGVTNASILVTPASAPIPEPATCLLLGGAVAAGLGLRRRKRSR